MRQERWNAPDGAGLALVVEQRDVALGRRVELENLWNAETVLEIGPDVTAQAVAAGESQPMRALARVWRRVQQVTAELADILEQRAIPVGDIIPELACRELVADHYRTAIDQHGAGGDDAADAVVHRQTIVH